MADGLEQGAAGSVLLHSLGAAFGEALLKDFDREPSEE